MELDAQNHDINCEYAADPRNKCTCGGEKATKPIDVDFAQTQQAAMTNNAAIERMEQRVATYGQQIMQNKADMINKAADKVFGTGNWEKTKITGRRNADGSESFIYDGQAFLDVSAITFENMQSDGQYVVQIKQAYKIIEQPPQTVGPMSTGQVSMGVYDCKVINNTDQAVTICEKDGLMKATFGGAKHDSKA